MKSRKQVRRGIFILCEGTFFSSQLIGLSIINEIGGYEQTMGFIVMMATVLTVLFSMEYKLFWMLYYRISKKTPIQRIGDEIYEMFIADGQEEM